MIKVGLTGGIGSGKTTIAQFFEILGIPVYYSDTEAKRLMINNKTIVWNLKQLLGTEVYLESGALNKTFLSNQIFKNKTLLEKVNKIIHPIVKQDFLKFCKIYKNKKYIIKESAILIETGLYKELDQIILVTANLDTRKKRVRRRDTINAEEVQHRMDKQWNDNKKTKFANFLVENNNKQFLIPQLFKIHNQLIR